MSNAASFSRVSLYKKCPASYEWQYVLGNKEAFSPGPAAERGTRIHNSIEDYFLDRGPLDPEVPDKFVTLFSQMKDSGNHTQVLPEHPFALTDKWEPTQFDADDAWVRGLMDNMFVYEDRLLIHEYKTGQEYPEHADQKQLYAMVGLILYPEFDSVEVQGVYIDGKKIIPTVYSRGHLQSMKFVWERQIKKMALPLYPARPGMHCRWCPKSSKKEGGSCPLG